jgi:hypothetical protein
MPLHLVLVDILHKFLGCTICGHPAIVQIGKFI